MAIISSHVQKVRQAIGAYLKAIDDLKSLDQEYTSLDVGNQMNDSDITAGDITTAQFISGITSIRTVTTIASGDLTNLYRASDGSQRP